MVKPIIVLIICIYICIVNDMHFNFSLAGGGGGRLALYINGYRTFNAGGFCYLTVVILPIKNKRSSFKFGVFFCAF